MITYGTKGGNGKPPLCLIFVVSKALRSPPPGKGENGMEAFGISAVAVILAFALLGITKGRKTAGKDFALSGRRASSWNVSGILLGALVGGASTVGTAEMAYVHGLSAWWFTLG